MQEHQKLAGVLIALQAQLHCQCTQKAVICLSLRGIEDWPTPKAVIVGNVGANGLQSVGPGPMSIWCLLQVQEAQKSLEALQARFKAFFQEFDFLCTPCVMVPPFDVGIR